MTTEECINVAAHVATEYFSKDVKPDHILSKSRRREHVVPRQVIISIIREKMGLNFSHIGKLFGKDHTTIISSITKVNNLIEVNDGLYVTIHERIMRAITLQGKEKTAIITFPSFADADNILDSVKKMYNVTGYIVNVMYLKTIDRTT